MTSFSRHAFENKRLTFNLSLKSLAEDGRFAGYASVFDVVDDQRDIVLAGAFRDTLRTRAGQVKLLWQHQFEHPIGSIVEIFEDARGLYVEGQLLLALAKAREAHALLKAGAIGGLSIGYSPVRYQIDPETGVRKLAAVELWEVSLVTFPANAQANVTVVKGRADAILHAKGDDEATEDAEWRALRRGGKLSALGDAIDRASAALR